MKFCIIDSKSFITDESLIAPLYELGEVSIFDGIPGSDAETVERAADADVIIFSLMQFDNSLLDRLPKLKLMQFIGTGMWNFVDVEYAKSKGIAVLNVDGYGNNAVAEFAMACAFTLSRHLTDADRRMKSRKWDHNGLDGIEIAGSVFAVVGTGNIGVLVAKKAAQLGARVIACDIYESEDLKTNFNVVYVSLEEAFSQADIVSLHLKTAPETEKIINKDLLSKMKPDAVLINAARAELVDYGALYDILKNNKIGGAAIDVYYSEPPAEFDLARLPNVIATPHIGYYTKRATDNSIVMSVDSVLRHVTI